MRRKGFTLVELLVVIAIIALLMGILMPALARVRQLAFRMVCGTNLSGIGKAMLIYANDYEDELPRAGGRESTWGAVANWAAPSRNTAYGLTATGGGGKASISSCFYLLVKYAEVTPKSFICKGDAGTSEFKLADVPAGDLPANAELIDLWEFGKTADAASKACSYSYHVPFGLYALTTSSEPGFAVAADRNPWIKSPGADAKAFPGAGPDHFQPDIQSYGGTTDLARNGNAITHQNEGQNVLFLDGHVAFEKRPYCSIEDDNIYTLTDKAPQGSAFGKAPLCTDQPQARKDSVLIHDGAAPPPKGRCFAGGTPVWVDGRLMPIDRVQVGQVAGAPCLALAAGDALHPVERVEVHEGPSDGAYTLILENGESLCVVGSHVFLLDSGTWVRLEDLRAGSVLRTHGAPIRVLAALRHSRPYPGTVYNLKIEDSNHYFVGRAGVVVRDY
jgi:prepilin-type N-terminal cleavage/methylation domain-containing protein/prepilin-type processing-associated H-X9-DG protein